MNAGAVGVLVLLVACGGSVDTTCRDEDRTTWYADTDGDGYAGAEASIEACVRPGPEWHEAAEDCDDLDPQIAPELLCYRDEDGDAYGVHEETRRGCQCPPGSAEVSGDCDDDDADLNPATEWFLDCDGDGYGSTAYTLAQCEQPQGYVRDHTDCDDVHADAYPGAVEVCLDGLDNDCDGDTHACEVDVEEAPVALWGEPGSGFGATAAVLDLDGDGLDEVAVGAPAWKDLGRAYLFAGLGPDHGADLIADEDAKAAWTWSYVVEGEEVGSRLSAAGDLDGDGTEDLLLGWRRGVALVYGGRDLPRGDLQISAASAIFEYGSPVYPARRLGDLDGGGADDLALRAEETLYLLHSSGVLQGEMALSDQADASISGLAGEASGVGDLDGDGLDDAVLGSSGEWYSDSAIWVRYGDAVPLAGAHKVKYAADANLHREGPDRGLGAAVAGGDLDQDGYPDLLVGEPGVGETRGDGAVHLFPGGHARLEGTVDVEEAPTTLTGRATSDGAGACLATGDVDGDGWPELLVGVPGDSTRGAHGGAVLLVPGPLEEGRQEIDSRASILGDLGQELGLAGVEFGDFDGDGRADALLLDPTGAAFIFFGDSDW